MVGGAGQPTVFNVLIENGAQAKDPGHRSAVAAPTGTVTVTGFPSGVPTGGTLSAGLDPNTGAVAGIATITVQASTPAANYYISISYSGDSNYAYIVSASGEVEIVSSRLVASSTTAAATGSISPTTSITVTGTVTGSGTKAPTGDLYVYSSGTYIAGTTIAPGTRERLELLPRAQQPEPFAGANFVTLQYFGDTTYAPSAYSFANPIANPLSDFTMVSAESTIPSPRAAMARLPSISLR